MSVPAESRAIRAWPRGVSADFPGLSKGVRKSCTLHDAQRKARALHMRLGATTFAPVADGERKMSTRGLGVFLAAMCMSIAGVTACAASRSGDPAPATIEPDGSAPDAPSFGSTTQCTGDMQGVVAGNGDVTSCGPGLGCSGGVCVAACNAAGASHGSLGCDFVVATPPSWSDTAPPCYAILLANGRNAPVHVSVSLGSDQLDATTLGRIATSNPDPTTWPTLGSGGIPIGAVAVLYMSGDPTSNTAGSSLACPVPQAVPQSTALVVAPGGQAATGYGTAFHVETDVPVTAYDILPVGGARSFFPGATLLLPTTAWDDAYVAVVPPGGRLGGSGLWGQVVAATDGTTVTVTPTVDLPSGSSVQAAPAGVSTKFTLDAGEFLQWGGAGDMTGTVVTSDKPIAFHGGNASLSFPRRGGR